jgi:phosphohistidine swiveling domain-containing protein
MSPEHRAVQSQGGGQLEPAPLVIPLNALDRALVALAGGKAANLGELIRAGFPVPEGFCVTTAAYALVSADARLEPLLAELAQLQATAENQITTLAATIHASVLHASVPSSVAAAIIDAYQELRGGRDLPVAVRSSATAEDLPGASFAGQHETALQVIGVEALLAAVQHCWASLWSVRAVRYRARLGIDPHTVRLAVVVQRMVDAEVAGVLFTANPLTGKRREAVLDASPGLGEAVVAGATIPDHFVVDTRTGAIRERRIGSKRLEIRPLLGGGTRRIERPPQLAACLSDTQVRALSALGGQVEEHFGAPQDIEWAIDAEGQCWLLQSRPITTLFPLPEGAPNTDAELRVYLCFNAQQGSTRPSTPIGISALRRLASAITAMVGIAPAESGHGPRFVTEAASRLFLDVTAALRHTVGRRILTQVLADAEVQAVAGFRQLVADPRLSLLPASPRAFVLGATRLLVRSRMPWYVLQGLLAPAAARARVARLERRLREAAVGGPLSPDDALAAVERLLAAAPALLFQVSPLMLAGMLSFTLAGKLLGVLATGAERQVVLQGTLDNPTVAMNQALWRLARDVQADAPAVRLLQDTPPSQLAAAYQGGALPAALQRGLTGFLQQYGHRSVDELDLGVSRWAEEPGYVLGMLAGCLALRDPAQAPDRQLQRAAAAGEAMVAELARRATRRGPLRGLLVGVCLRRARTLGGTRELPRHILALILAQARALLRPVATALVERGQLEQGDQIVFLTLPEVAVALAGTDMRATAQERRARYAEERERRHVPLVLVSDGTEPSIPQPHEESHGQLLQGTAAAAGRATGFARVLHDPHGATLLPGEILVASATDPGWTPLFLSAGGLVMELGGVMAHGAIVAREYGLPAVVGVSGATTRIATGSRITLDGTTGTVVVEGPSQPEASGVVIESNR